MDLCPVCGVAVQAEGRGGMLFWRCRNPQCPKYNQEVGEEEDKESGQLPEESKK